VQVAPRVGARAHYLGFRAVRSVGGGGIAREILPRFLIRGSEQRTGWRLSHQQLMRLHSVAAAAGIVAGMDLLDG
jgi:hypothetical protein